MKAGDKYYIITPTGKRSLEKFEVLDVNKAGEVKLQGNDGKKFRIHRNRIVQGTKASKPEASKPKVKKGTEAMSKTAKKDVEGFDVSKFAAGREHWVKEDAEFDHKEYKLLVHCIIDEKAGRYFVVNTYRYPSGTVSLGKNGAGITEYPLKGHKVTYTISQKAAKVESRGQKRQRKGSKTAEELRKQLEKKGYKRA